MMQLLLVCGTLLGFGVSLSLHAQHTVQRTNRNGQLIERTQLNAQNRITEIELFANGEVQRRTRRRYNAEGLLVEEVNTMYDDHEYDLITQYSYEGGLLANKLFGNNRSGRWSSEGYVYDEHGHLTRIDHYRKDGSLAYQTNFELQHRDTFILERIRTKIVLPVDSLHEAWENEVAIGNEPVPTPGEVKSAYAKTSYTYAPPGRLASLLEVKRDGTPIVKSNYEYLAGGKRRERTTIYSDTGQPELQETIISDARGRTLSRTMLGSTTRYSYYADTDVVTSIR